MMNLEECTFIDSVTYQGSDTTRLQAKDRKDMRTFAETLRVADGFVWWSGRDACPLANVRWMRVAAGPHVVPIEKAVERVAKAKR